MPAHKFWNLNTALIIVLLAASSATALFRLGSASLEGWDEGIYAQVAKEMLRSGDWLTPHFNSQPWFEKPPLTMWITAALFSVFGIGTFWARAASAFSGILLTLVTYLSGRKAYGTTVGALASAILLSSFVFALRTHDGRIDVELTLLIYVCVLAYQYARSDRRYWYAIGASFALAFLTKSWAALVIPPVLLATLIIDGNAKETLRSPTFWFAWALALALLVPWHAAMLALHPQAFIDRYITYDFASRASGTLGKAGTSTGYYLDVIMSRFNPWAAMVPFAIAVNLRALLQKRSRAEPIFLVLIAIVFGAFTLAVTRLPWYIFPVYPALCILIADMITRALKSHRSFAFSGLVVSLCLSLLDASSRAIVFLFLAPAALGAAAILLAWGAAGGQLAWLVRRGDRDTRPERPWETRLHRFREVFQRVPRSAWGARACIVAICIFFAGRSVSHARLIYDGGFSPLANLSLVAGRMDPGAPLLAVNMLDNPDIDVDVPQVLFYSDRPIISIQSAHQLATALADRRARDIVLHAYSMQQLADGYRFTVLAQAPPWIYATIEPAPLGATGSAQMYAFDGSRFLPVVLSR